jgi:hypothetical protein
VLIKPVVYKKLAHITSIWVLGVNGWKSLVPYMAQLHSVKSSSSFWCCSQNNNCCSNSGPLITTSTIRTILLILVAIVFHNSRSLLELSTKKLFFFCFIWTLRTRPCWCWFFSVVAWYVLKTKFPFHSDLLLSCGLLWASKKQISRHRYEFIRLWNLTLLPNCWDCFHVRSMFSSYLESSTNRYFFVL